MARNIKLFTLAIAVVASVLWAVPASAGPCGVSLPFGNSFTAGDGCVDGAPMSAVAYGLPHVSNGNVFSVVTGADIVCEQGGDPNVNAGQPCNIEAGNLGDGLFTLQGNWGNPPADNCPNPPGLMGVGRNVFFVMDNAGHSAAATVGYNGVGYYLDDIAAMHCQPTCILLGSTSGGGATVTANIQVTPPIMVTDCDPGNPQPSCTEGAGSIPVGIGKVYTTTGPCSTSNLDLKTAGWTLAGTPDGSGHLSVQVNKPLAPDTCAFIGATFSFFGGPEGPAVGCLLPIAGQLSATPKPLDVKAGLAKAGVQISWRTDTELGVVGFNVIGSSRKGEVKLNGAMIPAKGVNGAGSTYAFKVGTAALKGTQTVTVEAVLNNGGSVRSDAVNITKGASK